MGGWVVVAGGEVWGVCGVWEGKGAEVVGCG